MKNPRHLSLICIAVAALTASVSSCNVFDPFDSPTSDEQLISGARACLDRADFECALDLYGKLSGDKADVRLSEEAYVILQQNGAGFGTFAASFGASPNGGGLSKMANTLVTGAGEARRLALYTAYQKLTTITEPHLKGLVQFVTAAAIAAEILAEAAGADGLVTASDLASGGAACNSTELGTCGAAGGCDAPASNVLAVSGTDSDLPLGAPTGTLPTLDQLYSAVGEATTGLNAAGASGSGTAFGGLLGPSTKPSASGGTLNGAQARCFRAALINQKVGI